MCGPQPHVHVGLLFKTGRGPLYTEKARKSVGGLLSATLQERLRDVEIQAKQASVKGPAETFTGDVWFDVIARGEDYAHMRVNVVRFAPGARTAWHSHPGGQTLYVTEGRGLVQSRGGEVIEIRPGDVIYTPPGEWHWHGAAPDHFMSHVAMWEVDDEGNSATWGALVADEEYCVQARPTTRATSGPAASTGTSAS